MAITRVVAGLLCLAVASAASPLAPTTLSNLNLRGGGKYFPKMPDSVKPGVVTGQALKDLLATAKEHGYAIPAVNCIGTGSINQVLEAAKKFNCPVMVQFSNGGSQFYAGKSLPNDKDKLQACVLGAVAVSLLAGKFPSVCSLSRAEQSCCTTLSFLLQPLSVAAVRYLMWGQGNLLLECEQ